MGLNLTSEQLHDLKVALGNAAPGGVATVAAEATGFTGADLIKYATLTLIVVQILYYAWKWRRDIVRHRREKLLWETEGRDRRKYRGHYSERASDRKPCDTHESQFDAMCPECTKGQMQ